MHKGRVHSIETFGTVDGPGIRFVLFMQGCALRCRYCHNPDSWNPGEGQTRSVEQLLNEIAPYVEYYRGSGGGITVSGGEPTLQAPFVAELFQACKERWGLHTALDSSGYCEVSHLGRLLDYTDLVLFDLKAMDTAAHAELTGQPNERIAAFARHLSSRGNRMWIRHVLVPGVTDGESELMALGRFAASLNGVEKLELLPYHRMGVYKWERLGLAYPLDGILEPAQSEMERAYALVMQGEKLYGSGERAKRERRQPGCP